MRIEIVFVCTANVNRSPMAAALLGLHIARLVPPLPPGSVTISSAGLLVGGLPSSHYAIATLLARGVDLGGHCSRTLSPEIVRAADLVITMERAHLRAAAVLVPGALEKTFTLRELVRRGGEPSARLPDAHWYAAMNVGRTIGELLRDDPADDVGDPVGGTRADFDRTADELDGLTRRLAQLLFGAR